MHPLTCTGPSLESLRCKSTAQHGTGEPRAARRRRKPRAGPRNAPPGDASKAAGIRYRRRHLVVCRPDAAKAGPTDPVDSAEREATAYETDLYLHCMAGGIAARLCCPDRATEEARQ